MCFRAMAVLLTGILLAACAASAPQTLAPTLAPQPAGTARAVPTAAPTNEPPAVPTVVPTADASAAAVAAGVPTDVPATRSTVEPTVAPTVTPLATPGSVTQLEGQALVEALRGGGYVIFLRHTATDQSRGDSDDQRLLDCTKQRNLNDQGRADAQAIGEAFRALQIPIGQVLSSKYCRTLDTTQLAFGETFTPTDDITGFNLAPDSQERRRRNAALRDLLSRPPAPGTNLVLVSHQFNLGDVTGLESKEGDTLVFAPSGPAGFTLVARIPIGGWAELRKQAQE